MAIEFDAPYRNSAGITLHVVGIAGIPPHDDVRTIGGIYVAEDRNPAFGTTTFLVTEESLAAAGYALVPASPEGGEQRG